MNIKFTQVGFFILIVILSISCASTKKIAYFQDEQSSIVIDSLQNYEPKIQSGDLLIINVSAVDNEVAAPFNLYESTGVGTPKPITYLVNKEGTINFPIIGKVKVLGYTTNQATENLTKLLKPYLKTPIVNLRITNFKITVLGEVKKPGTYPVNGERISVFDAIGMAGDLTIQGKRTNVTLLREENGTKKYVLLDLTNKNIVYSPYFYLMQNDVIYVEPNKAKVNSSVVGPNSTILISAFSALISLMAILNVFK